MNNNKNKKYWEAEYDYTDNYFYQQYVVQRDKLKEKYKDVLVGQERYPGPDPKEGYPPYLDKERNRHRKYLKELGDLMYASNGWFQKFMWDIVPTVEALERERRTRRRKNDSKYC